MQTSSLSNYPSLTFGNQGLKYKNELPNKELILGQKSTIMLYKSIDRIGKGSKERGPENELSEMRKTHADQGNI